MRPSLFPRTARVRNDMANPELSPPLCIFDRSMRSAEILDFQGGRCAVFTSRPPVPKPGGIDPASSPNEDSIAVIPGGEKGGVLAVADGVGGLPGGAHASSLALGQVAEAVAHAAGNGRPLRDAILDGIEGANEELLRREVGATTLALAEIKGGVFRPYHVGDSVILLVGPDGDLRMRTVAHSPVGYALEAGALDEWDAMHHQSLHLIANVMGSDLMRVEIGYPVRLRPGETIVIASDGVLDNLHSTEIARCFAHRALEAATQQLIAQCERRMRGADVDRPSKPDDFSFIAFQLLEG